LKVLQEDKRAIFGAADNARRAADYLDGLQLQQAQQEEEREGESGGLKPPLPLGTTAGATWQGTGTMCARTDIPKQLQECFQYFLPKSYSMSDYSKVACSRGQVILIPSTCANGVCLWFP